MGKYGILTLACALIIILPPLTGVVGGVYERQSWNNDQSPRGEVLISFPIGGGIDTSYSIKAPRKGKVLDAALSLEGQASIGPQRTTQYDFTDTINNKAWDGTTTEYTPSSPPTAFMDNQFDSQAYNDVAQEDGTGKLTVATKLGTPYQLFCFKIKEDVVNTIVVRWVGLGMDLLLNQTGASVYIYRAKGSAWDEVGSYGHQGSPTNLQTLQKSFPNGANYVDGQKKVYVLVLGPAGFIFGMVSTDYIEIKVTGAIKTYPKDLNMDIGMDGSIEWKYPGELRSHATIGADILVPAIQKCIDNCEYASEPLYIQVKFTSTAAGKLRIYNDRFVFDLPPVFMGIPSKKLKMKEDVEAKKLIDLNNYFTDDYDAGNLTYEIIYQEDEDKVKAKINSDGHSIDFIPVEENWNGVLEFGINATDSSGLSTIAFFNLTVEPVNDPPVLSKIGNKVAKEDEMFNLIVSASDVDDKKRSLRFYDNSPLFEIDHEMGTISWTPTNDQVGIHQVMIWVEDPQGAIDAENITITVLNVNDPPILEPIGDQVATEDEEFEMKVVAHDIDVGDRLTYYVDTELEEFEIDKDTGEVSFTPTNDDVGEHEVTFIVKDEEGATAEEKITLIVENVNDPPVIEPIRNIKINEDEEFELKVIANDPDKGDEITFSDNTKLFKIDPKTGEISFTPTNDDVGKHRIEITVTDKSGATASTSFTLEVKNVNDPPQDVRILTPSPGSEYKVNEDIKFSGIAVEVDKDDVLKYIWKEGDIELAEGQNVTLRLPKGEHTITLEVVDSYGGIGVNTTTIKVVERSTTGAGTFSGNSGMALIAGIIIVAIIVVALGVFFFYDMKKRKERMKMMESMQTEPTSPFPEADVSQTPPPPPPAEAGITETSPMSPPMPTDDSTTTPPPPTPTSEVAGETAIGMVGVLPPDGEIVEPPKAIPKIKVKRGEVVTRGAVRVTIRHAKESINKAKSIGVDVTEAEELLREAYRLSYRKEYKRARECARKAEAIASELMERRI